MELQKIRVIEVLNAYPGETFIRQHGKAITEFGNVSLTWIFLQTSMIGPINRPFDGLKNCIALPNFNRLNRFKKLYLICRYLSTDKKKIVKKVFQKHISKVKPEIIHFHFFSTLATYSFLIDGIDVKITASLRGSDIQVHPYNDPTYKKDIPKLYDKCSGIHAVCIDLKKKLLDFVPDAEKLTIIRTAVDNKWYQIKRIPEKGTFIAVGRLHWRKDFASLLIAFSKVHKVHPWIKLLIAGEGEKRQELEFIIRDLELTNVTLLGNVTHEKLIELYSKADFIIQSSIAEGFPNSLAEAMAAGVPIISTDCDGIPELLKNDENGLIANTGNVNELAEKILQAVSLLPEIKDNFVKKNQTIAEVEFSFEKHANSFNSFYNKVI